jgi:hypothetical protein
MLLTFEITITHFIRTALCAACLAAAPSPTLGAESDSVSFPIRLSNGRALFPARVNNEGTNYFLVDSAYTISTLHPDLADRLSLQPSGRVTIGGIAGDEQCPTYRGVSFDLEGFVYEPRRVASVPSERDHRRRRDGILGSGFFHRYVIEIDCGQKTATLRKPEFFSYQGKGEIVPFRFKGDIPVVRAAIGVEGKDPVEAEFEIDTGCDSGLCLGASFVNKNQLLDAAKQRDSEKSGIGGTVETKSGHVASLRLGNLEIREPQTDFFQKGSPVDEPLAGHIGMGTLRGFRIIFDYRRERIILETSETTASKPPG